jgi:hypothetical protein
MDQKNQPVHKSSRQKAHQDSVARTITDLAIYLLLPWILVFLAKKAGGSTLIGVAGATAILALTLVKLTRYKPLVFFSVLFILLLLMALIWRWTDLYLIRIITADIASNTPVLITGITDSLLSIALLLLYQQQLTNLRLKITYEWYASKTYRKFIRIVIYFLEFLLLFLLLGFLLHRYAERNFETKDLTITASVVAFIIAAIQTLFFLFLPQQRPTIHHRHRSNRHRRHKQSSSST